MQEYTEKELRQVKQMAKGVLALLQKHDCNDPKQVIHACVMLMKGQMASISDDKGKPLGIILGHPGFVMGAIKRISKEGDSIQSLDLDVDEEKISAEDPSKDIDEVLKKITERMKEADNG